MKTVPTVVQVSSLSQRDSSPPTNALSSAEYTARDRALSRRWRCVIMVIIMLSHAIVIAATLMFARLHEYITATVRLGLDFRQLGAEYFDYFDAVRGACYAAASCHFLALVFTLYRLIQTNRYRWQHKVSVRDLTDTFHFKSKTVNRIFNTTARVLTLYPTELAQFRLLLEIGLQSYQAYKMSGFVATIWLNRLLAFIIIINCWFTPIIYWMMRRNSLFAKRLLRLGVDTLLDITYSIGLPYIVLYPYIREFIPANTAFPYHYYVQDVWISVATAENRQVFISSWTDWVSKVSPWYFLCYRLQAIRHIVSRNRKTLDHDIQEPRSRLSKQLNFLLWLSGLVVLGLHLQVTWVANTASVRGCLVEMRPWLGTSYACSVLEISCSQRGMTGAKDDIDNIFKHIDPDRVQALVIAHCPYLEIPSSILTLSEVTMIKTYNTTIVDWGVNALVTEETNPNIQQFFVVHTNFTEFPEGLLSPDFPKALRDVKFVGTNLTTLPLSLATAWSGTKYLVVELCPLMVEMPPVISRMTGLFYSSISSTSIARISEATFDAFTPLFGFYFVNNPSNSLPDNLGRLLVPTVLGVVYTNISTLPATWLSEAEYKRQNLHFVQVHAEHTPLCSSLLTRGQLEGTSVSTIAPELFNVSGIQVYCGFNMYAYNVSYPLDKEVQWRQTN